MAMWAIRNEAEARSTARLLRSFRERLSFLDLERTSISAIIAAHEEQLVDYHRRIREMLAREAEEAEQAAEALERGSQSA